jgi:hypothetical protein
MPEGPTIVILKEQAAAFDGRVVERVAGNSTQDIQRMRGRKILAIRSWASISCSSFPASACACISCCTAVAASTSGARPRRA